MTNSSVKTELFAGTAPLRGAHRLPDRGPPGPLISQEAGLEARGPMSLSATEWRGPSDELKLTTCLHILLFSAPPFVTNGGSIAIS